MIEGFNPTILFGWAVAALLFALALWAASGGLLRRGAHLGFAGMAVLGALTLYSHDVMAMPQICAALLIGSGVGLLLGRGVPGPALPALLAGLMGQAGLAAVLLGLAAGRNPHAFGLLDEMTDRMGPGAAMAMAAGMGFGAMTCAGAVATLGWGSKWLGWLLPAVAFLAAGILWVWARDPQLTVRGGGIGVGLAIGHALIKGAMRTGPGPALALLGGMAGWAVAASAFLLENMGMAVAGGLAGAAGSVFALRLCAGAGRKGLAHGGRQP